MRAVVQRVAEATVTVDGERVGSIEGPGLCVLVGVTHDDTPAKAAQLARKLWTLRLFDGSVLPPAAGHAGAEAPGAGPADHPAEQSCSDLDAPLLVISQFTLYGDARKGRRPTWNAAAPGPLAEPLVDAVVAELRALGATVETGRFGADMKVALVNDGPFTVQLEI
ncbi:D-aminoacyl-tRNA deacylase [Saccharothrix sp. ST-888]|uniref:D-aminoacyl-tRNA deacylase n=1 Tax=Saccharothrix sp. ST-888 TaxID=1427391 RepID=UPI0005EC08A3|nr:D-aminoacyl-tRNA deacylase [Saccharothrix sp. ST-888]KJK56832.1 D-tyrosyl-tRNA(Tyr) deacylase [Saccharothrix sp. ST-888]